MIKQLLDLVGGIENQADKFAGEEDFDLAAASLKSAELVNKLINVQKAIQMKDQKYLEKFLNDV